MNNVKELIRTVVPSRLLKKAIQARDYVRFISTPKQNFNPANLSKPLPLFEIMNAPDLELSLIHI